MARRDLVLRFSVDEGVTEEVLYALAERIVADIVPDPPVLTYEGAEIHVRPNWEPV